MKKVLIILSIICFTIGVGSYRFSESTSISRKVNLSNKESNEKINIFKKEAKKLDSSVSLEDLEKYKDLFIEIYIMYKENHINEPEDEIIRMAVGNVVDKIKGTISEEEYEESLNGTPLYQPDGYEFIVNYINDKLNPNFKATLETPEENIKFLRENMNRIPVEMRSYATEYIEDIELDIKYQKMEKERIKY